MGQMNNWMRCGHFTSSMVYKLIPYGSVPMTPEELVEFKKANPGSRKRNKDAGFNAAGETYITEKNIERKLGTCLDGGAHTQVLAWGNLMELCVYSILGEQYQIASKDTKLHPEYGEFWSGSVDLFTENPSTKEWVSIAEIKCYQKKNFSLYTDCILQKDIELFKEEFPKEYWQIVSNAIINGVDVGEAISFMPTMDMADEIKQFAMDYEGEDYWKYKFVVDLDPEDLPFLQKDGYYESINKFAFIVPEEDKELLTSRILEASQLLIPENHAKS